MAIIYKILVASGFVALLMLFISGPGYRAGLWSLGPAFLLLQIAAVLGIISVVLPFVYSIWQRPTGLPLLLLIASGCAGLVAFSIPYAQFKVVKSVPMIHDISTDVANPPAFVDIAPLRKDAPNPVGYAGEETAQQQQAAYPDLETLHLKAMPKTVFSAATEVVKNMGWELVATAPDAGRIEATDTTFWFGFKDDVVIRIQPAGEGSLVDVRSKSRVGKSDVGVNAKRIRTFRQALLAKVN